MDVMKNKVVSLILIVIVLISQNCYAGYVALSYFKRFAFLGGQANSTDNTKLHEARVDSSKELELLYLVGISYGPLIGIANGERSKGFKQEASPGRIENSFGSNYRYNALKIGAWMKAPYFEKGGGQFVVSYGKGAYDFYVIDDTTPEITKEPTFMEVEARGVLSVLEYSGVKLDLYGGVSMYKIQMSDIDYNGVSYKNSEFSSWGTLNLSVGVGVSY